MQDKHRSNKAYYTYFRRFPIYEIDFSEQRIHSDRIQLDRLGQYFVEKYGTIVASTYENCSAKVYSQVTNTARMWFRALEKNRIVYTTWLLKNNSSKRDNLLKITIFYLYFDKF